MADIVRFSGGLGNQMFQYALVIALRNQGRDVKGCLRYYDIHPEKMRFKLNDVFENVIFENVSNEAFNAIDEKWKEIKANKEKLDFFLNDYKNRFFWVQKWDGYSYEPEVFETSNCVFVGCWESPRYFDQYSLEVKKAFEFNVTNQKLKEVGKTLRTECYTSLHVRRGDYLEHDDAYGGCCSIEYYKNAVKYIMDKNENSKFIVFSDDIEWAKKNIVIENGIYSSRDMFDCYEDWYDMYLMTCCANNIVANSSFSWWGAWLNDYERKIVISPKRWYRKRETPEVYPKDWIRIPSE